MFEFITKPIREIKKAKRDIEELKIQDAVLDIKEKVKKEMEEKELEIEARHQYTLYTIEQQKTNLLYINFDDYFNKNKEIIKEKLKQKSEQAQKEKDLIEKMKNTNLN